MNNKIYNFFEGLKVNGVKIETVNNRNNMIEENDNEVSDEEAKYELTSLKKGNYLKDFDFLVFSITDVMTCKYCIQNPNAEKNEFATGSRSYKKSIINNHGKSDLHKKSVAFVLKKSEKIDISNVFSINLDLDEEKLIPIFKNILFLAENNIPIIKCTNLHEYLSSYDIEIPFIYRNPVKGTEIMKTIASVIFDDLITCIKSNKYISFSIDESTDFSKKQQLCFVARYLSKDRQ